MRKGLFAVLFVVVFVCMIGCAAMKTPQTAEQAEPLVRLTLANQLPFKDSCGTSHNDAYVFVELLNCDDFISCEIEITRPLYFSYYEDYDGCDGIDLEDVELGNCNVTVESPERGCSVITLQPPVKDGKDPFAKILYLSALAQSELSVTVDSVKLYTADGEAENVQTEIINEIPPKLMLHSQALNYTAPYMEAEKYICFDCSLTDRYRDFESFEMLISYNPTVLEYSEQYPFGMDDYLRNNISCTVQEPGKLQVVGSSAGQTGCGDFYPFCFKFIGEGPTDIEVTLVSWKNTDGEIENGIFEKNIQNFNADGEELYDDASSNSFDSISFLVIGEGDPNINISFVSAMDLYEQDVDCVLEVNGPVAW